ncbi:MAG: 5-formyltetrahydrofolate cyclo-ligase [Hyphomicrobiaceae bacterium]|jgi:5-formyltetrahydrofolate cyclo-ligase
MTTDRTKQALRVEARELRDREAANAGPAALEVSGWAADLLALSRVERPIVSSYLVIGSELDPAPLTDRLKELGATTALPVMTAKAAPLEFRTWMPGGPLVSREWGIREPGPDCAVVEPDILLVPLLLVGRTGHRLGYGGGFYDRTLERLRSRKSIVAIGFSYLFQKVDAVPQEAYDQPLDYLLTPSGFEKFQP